MINFKSESELRKILDKYKVSGLIFDSRKDAGPDEEIYFYHDKEGHKFILWSRDYMSELFFEAQGLQNNFSINVVKWFELTDGGSYDPKYSNEDNKKILFLDGMCFALGLISE